MSNIFGFLFSLFIRIALVIAFVCLIFIEDLQFPFNLPSNEQDLPDYERNLPDYEQDSPDYEPSLGFPRDEDAYQASLYDVNALRKKCFYGTNQYLSGKVTAVVIYMEDFESDWTNDEIDEFTENDVEPALEFLEKEAEKYGIELDFEIKVLRNGYYDAEVVTDIDAAGCTTIDALEQAAKSYDYESQYDIHDRMAQDYGTEVVFITVFNKPGCSYGLNPKPWTDFKAVEHCIMFSIDMDNQTEYEPGTNATIIVCTMLHLFGGESLNKPEGRQYIAQWLYPHDIMRIQPFDIAESEIGSATAYYIGWTDDVPEAVYSQGWNEYD